MVVHHIKIRKFKLFNNKNLTNDLVCVYFYIEEIEIIISYVSVRSKHILEDQNKEEASISPEETLIAEHERLTAEYHNEKALLEEALRKSSKNTSDDESTEEAERATASIEKESSEKFHQLEKTEPLKPIPISKKKSDEDEVIIFNLLYLIY